MTGLRLTPRGERVAAYGFLVLFPAVLSLAAHLVGPS